MAVRGFAVDTRLGRSAMIEDRRRGAFCLGHFGCFQAQGAANRREPPACGSSSGRDPIGRRRDAQVGYADSDEAGQVFRFEAGHPYRFEAGHCTEVMSAKLRRSSRVGGMMGSALWSGQERAVADSGGDFTLPFGHPFVRSDGHPFIPTCALEGGRAQGRSRMAGRPPRQRRVASLTALSTLPGWRGLGRRSAMMAPLNRVACACSRLRARCGRHYGRCDRGWRQQG